MGNLTHGVNGQEAESNLANGINIPDMEVHATNGCNSQEQDNISTKNSSQSPKNTSIPHSKPCEFQKISENIPQSNGYKAVEDTNDVACRWRSSPEDVHEEFLKKLFDMVLKKAVFEGTDRNGKVVEWASPEELPKLIDLKLTDGGTTHNHLHDLLSKVVQYSVKTGHPHFVNQLFSGLDPYGLAGQLVTDALNPSVYTYEVAPVFTLMEFEVLSMMAQFVGYKSHDGVFAPGGSIANLYAMMIARHYIFPDVKKKGIGKLGNLAAFCSEDAHYSMNKGAIAIGIGTDHLYPVSVDESGSIDPASLEESIQIARQNGDTPFFVCATAGTTVLGAFDPIPEISSICKREKVWLHVDAAWGGGALLSPLHKHKLKGIENSDSVTWNPHKLMAAPQQCSVLLTRHENLLTEANSSNASYLFQKDKFYDTSYDTGDKYIQCGRRADVLKIWTMWKAKGSDGLRKHIDELFSMSQYMCSLIKSRAGFELVSEPQCTNVCFWFEPKSLRNWTGSKEEYETKLHKVSPRIKERMIKGGKMMITYQPLRHYPNFFRLVLQSSAVNKNDIEYFVNTIEELGNDL